MEIRVLGAHNLESPTTRHTCFLIDGVLVIDAGSLVTALNPEEQSRIRAVLLTHQHFDHTRDIPTLGLATLNTSGSIEVYSLLKTLQEVQRHLMDGAVYPDFTQSLNGDAPKYHFHPVEPGKPFPVLGYEVKAVPSSHSVPATGYIVRSSSGMTAAYTGDIGGPVAPFLQDEMAPEVLFVDVTFPARMKERAQLTGHLTPGLLREQLVEALEAKIDLPRIIAVHISREDHDEVVEEIESVAQELGIDLTVAHEDMVVTRGAAR